MAQLLLTVILATQTGSLTITARPGCEVFWEGVGLGKVTADGSLRVTRIPPGTYRVSVQMPGFIPEERRVSIGQDDQTIAFNLKSLPVAVAKDAPAQVQDRGTPQPRTAGPTPPAALSPPSPGDPAQPSLPPTAASLEERSSQIQDTLQTPLFWSMAVTCALLAALFRFLWSQRKLPKGPVVASGKESTKSVFSSARESGVDSWPAPPAFLEDLKRREKLFRHGNKSAPEKASDEPIELGRDDVRAVEE